VNEKSEIRISGGTLRFFIALLALGSILQAENQFYTTVGYWDQPVQTAIECLVSQDPLPVLSFRTGSLDYRPVPMQSFVTPDFALVHKLGRILFQHFENLRLQTATRFPSPENRIVAALLRSRIAHCSPDDIPA